MKIFQERALFILWYILLICGAIDPLEWSIIIAIGSVLITIFAIISHDHYRRLYIIACILILIWVFFMRCVSMFGWFDPKTERYRFIPLSVYPIWRLLSITLLVIKAVNKKRQ